MSQRLLTHLGKHPFHVYSCRLKNAQSWIKRKKIEGFLVTTLDNVRYLTGFTGSSGILLLTKKEIFFLTDFRYKEQADNEVNEAHIVIVRGDLIKTIRTISRKTATRHLGIESSITYALFQKLSRMDLVLKPYDGVIERLRAVKDDFELKKIQEAVRRAEISFLQVRPYIRRGVSERAIALRLEEKKKKNGCRRIPFEIIVASGPHAAMPHARPTERTITQGDSVIIDWGGEADGYFSDMTRTLLVKGDNIIRKKRIYNAVLRANKKALARVLPGTRAKDIDSAARDVIGTAGYSKNFGHATGHGVGLQIHELPRITWNKNEMIRENMIFTIEPGIYVPGLGGVRIEDMVVAKPVKPVVLTTLSKKLDIISL
jgi:Xaa-Pro aminopeptidase